MKSCIYTGTVTHNRFTPRDHEFHYEMDYLFLDLAETEELCDLSAIWSYDKSNLISIRRDDYLPGPLTLEQQVHKTVKELGGEEYTGSTYLLSTPRRLGHCMNPISLFYCYNKSTKAGACKDEKTQELVYVLAEVHNTPWDQRHLYLLRGPDFSEATKKAFHVSPFMPMDTNYAWQLSDPNQSLRVGIRVSRDNSTMFTASMDLTRQAFTKRAMGRINRRQLSQAFKTMAGIYFQALNLWLKKVPFFSHPDKIKLQES